MKLYKLSVRNYKSFISTEDILLNEFQAFIGENNAGKSNMLAAIEVLCSAGSGGVKPDNFNNPDDKIIIKGEFKIKSARLKRIWKPYLINDQLILEKHIHIEEDTKTKRQTVKNEYHGYKAEPNEWFLSIDKIKDKEGNRPDYKKIVEDNSLPDYFIEEGRSNQTIFKKALERYLTENDIEYDEPDISATQALGLQSNVIANLPKFYLLKAITDYADEIDKRSSNTTFRKLMGDLSERILQNDPKYSKIQTALDTIHNLLNQNKKEEEPEVIERLSSLSVIEEKIRDVIKKLIPSVEKITLNVITEDIKSIFSKGVELSIDDGVETDVLSKGHGLQRCIVFALLQTLILNERNELVDNDEEKIDFPLILAIEEPELYIHPQLGKLYFDVLKDFSESNQVLYTTHSPRFIDVYEYESIAIVTKDKDRGTKIQNCITTSFDGMLDKKIFQGITQLNSDVNELFFAKNVVLLEGPEDKIAFTETCKKIGKIINRTEEINITLVATSGIDSMPFFIRVLNAFNINYVVLHDTDIMPDMEEAKKTPIETRNKRISDLTRSGKLVKFPIKLEETLGLSNHLKNQYFALKYLSDHNNINQGLVDIIKDVLLKISNN